MRKVRKRLKSLRCCPYKTPRSRNENSDKNWKNSWTRKQCKNGIAANKKDAVCGEFDKQECMNLSILFDAQKNK